MEEDIRKQGMLFLQQQRFGKKWKKVWCILFRESACSISRLEFFECKDGGGGGIGGGGAVGGATLERSDKTLRKQQEHKKVIRLSDCIRVSEVEMEACPRDCGAFLVETNDKLFMFAAENAELDDWTQRLCEIAFPMSWGERGGMKRSSQHRSKPDVAEEGMEDNSLYSGRDSAVKDFKVVVRRTEAADRCRLRGPCVLRTDFDSLLLKDPKTSDILFTWPYRFLRRFGRDKVTFSFEAGRRCDSGEGSFEFDTKQGNALFLAVESAINLQRSSFLLRQASGGAGQETEPPLPWLQPPQPASPEPSAVYSTVNEAALQRERDRGAPPPARHQTPPQAWLEPPAEKLLTGVKSLTLDTRPSPHRKNQVKNISSCPLLSESQTYSEISLTLERGGEEERLPHAPSPHHPHPHPPHPSSSNDSDYSLPFDTIAKKLMADMLSSAHFGMGPDPVRDRSGREDVNVPDPLYDSIDESAVRSGFLGLRPGDPKTLFPRPEGSTVPPYSRAEASKAPYARAEHIYDEPEGCAVVIMAPGCPASIYDNPEEVRGHAWRIMGTAKDPNGHEYPYNPSVDDYAVPKPPKRAFPPKTQRPPGEGEEEEEDSSSPYDNVMVKMADREK